MKIPYIKYIETLVAGGYKPQQVCNDLESIGISTRLDIVNYVSEVMRTNNPEQFEEKSPDPLWLHELGIEKMYSYKFQVPLPPGVSGIEGAFKVLNDPLMYRLITSMAMANMNEEDIELIVNGKYDIEYASEDINEFVNYFFNVKDWTIVNKQKYVETVKVPELKNAYKLALKGDKDYLLWKLGAAPEKSFDIMLKDMMVDSYYNFKERAKGDPELAQKWGTLAVKLTDRLEKLEKETHEKQDMFADIQFQIKNSPTSSEDGKTLDSNKPDLNVNVSINNKDVPHISELAKDD